MANNKTLLLLALAGAGGFYLYSKGSTTATAPATGAAASADVLPSADVLATAASAPALRDVPDDVAQLALRAGMDLATVVALVRYDAIIFGHPRELSTQYFLADSDTWQAAVQRYKESGIPELAARVGLDPATVLDVAFLDAQTYGHPTELSTKYLMADITNVWGPVYQKYKQSVGLSGLAGGFVSALDAGAPGFAPQVAAASPW